MFIILLTLKIQMIIYSKFFKVVMKEPVTRKVHILIWLKRMIHNMGKIVTVCIKKLHELSVDLWDVILEKIANTRKILSNC